MKLHENRRMRKKLQRSLSLLIAAGMIFSGSASPVASAEGAGVWRETVEEMHIHDENCYENRIVCGKEEYTESQQVQALICGAEESEGHAHGDGCYGEEDTLICQAEEQEGHVHGDICRSEDGTLICGRDEQEGHIHDAHCYGKNSVLTCGTEEREAHIHTDNCYAPEENRETGEGFHQHTEECREPVLICGKTESTVGGTGDMEPAGSAASVPEGEGGSQDTVPEGEGTDQEAVLEGEGTDQEAVPEGEGADDETGTGDDEAVEAVNELLAALPGREEMAARLAEYEETPENWYQCLGQLGAQMREACGAWMALDRVQRSRTEGIEELLGLMITRKETEDSFLERRVFCGREAHLHVELEGCRDAEGNLVCGEESHTHLEAVHCYDEEGVLTCETEEHIHATECYRIPGVSEGDQAAIEKAGVLIAALPALEKLTEELEGYGEDTEGYGACLALAAEKSKEAREACTALDPVLLSHVANLEKLTALEAALAEWAAENPDTEPGIVPEETSCGKTEHTHTEDCLDKDGKTICGSEEHSHFGECFLTEAEKERIEKVNQLIAALPSEEEVMQKMAESEEDEDAWTALVEQVAEAGEAYRALGEKLQQYVAGAEYLLALGGILSGITLEENVWGPMGADEAYVNEIKITGMSTGSAPFDTSEGQGNDTTPDDKIVRTFDTVTYTFSANMKSWDSSKSYSEARVKLEFVLPLTEKEAVFDQTAMAWMDQTEGYKPVLTTENRIIDGEEKACQVLTCYKWLLPSAGNQSVVPGDFGENVTINVLAMGNGEEFAPVFSAAMEGGAWEKPCDREEHKIDGQPAVEKKTVTAEKVKVTAAPKYNIQVKGNASYHDEFYFGGDEEWFSQYGDKAANTDIVAPLPGRAMVLGVTLQLYNDNAAKGLKGIELPDGSDITFDIKLSSTYTLNQPNEGYNKDQAISDPDYAPLLWSYNEVDWKGYGDINKDGRPIYDSLRAIPYAPYYVGNGEENACFNSGGWKVTQEGDTLHVTVSGYEIDTRKMPKVNGDWGTLVRYDANVGCFSSGEIWLVQPFNVKEGEGREPEYDIVKEYGQGFFATTAEAANLKAVTASGTKLVEGENGFDQVKSEDDGITRTLELTLGGELHNRVRYAGAEEWKKGSGIEDNRDGRDYAAVGTEINLMGGLSYNPKREAKNQMYLGTTLMKFYGSALEPEGEWFLDLDGGAALNGHGRDETEKAEENVRVYYAVKPDGKDWGSDDELLHTYEDQLVFYDSLDAIPEGKICVGMLIGFVGPGAEVDAQDPYYNTFHKAKVRDEAKLIGQTFMLASTSRVWTKEMFAQVGMTPEDINLTEQPDLNVPELILGEKLWNCGHYTSANIGEDTFYKKETYRPDGSGIYGTHNSDWSHWGDTLLVIGYKTKISKYLMQKENNGGEKQTFNLDADQRVVDFKLEPGTYFDQPGNFPRTATITIVDTLPKYLTYKPGSSYFGGTYQQTAANGGTQGSIIEDTSLNAEFPTPELKEPTVVTNADGTQTLTWTVEDVEIGTPMAPIYYAAVIGVKGDPGKDVPTGTTNLKNEVYIAAPGDLRDHVTTGEKHSSAGIAVTRGSASSFGKYTKQKLVDEDGAIDYVVYYNNNAETGIEVVMMDTMPMNGENGSHFTGTYTFAEWKLDPAKCKVENIHVYYTFDTKYKNQTTKDVTRETIESWKQAAVNADGTIGIPTETEGATEAQPYPVAWAVVGTLDSGESVNIDLKIRLEPGASDADKKEYNYFVNLLSSGDTTTTTETPTVRRTLEGLAWMDYNRDGLQDDPRTEVRISGVKVELLKLREGGDPKKEDSYEQVYYPSTEIPVAVETGKQVSVRAKDGSEADDYELGRYKFSDLAAGTYAVRFTDGSDTQITIFNATGVDCGDDDRRDSDAVASRDETGKLVKTTILDVEMPRAEDMNVSLYESKFHDSGFYPDTKMTLRKVGENGEPLTGAIFTIQDEAGENVSFVYDEERGYTPYDEAGEASRKDKYYIALASNPYYVIGINGTGNGSLPILQNRTGNASQLFEVLKDGDGYYSFRNAACGKCLDLEKGNCQDGAKVHVWSGDPDTNKKWYLTEADGGCYISPLGGKLWGGDNWCLDLEGGTVQENQKIQLWSKNNSPAQKWVLIPAGITEGTRTDLNVDSSEGLTINNLKPGSYTITELKSPTGHSLLSRPVAFTVQEDGSIVVADASGGMAGVDSQNNTVLKIRNIRLYTLPSTGGPGTGTYALTGTLLMICALLYAFYGRRKKTK